MDDRTLVNAPVATAPPSPADATLIGVPASAEATVVGSPVGPERTRMGVAVACPICETQNAPGEIWCAECGFKLDATPGEAGDAAFAAPPAELIAATGETYALRFGENTVGRQDVTILLSDTTVSRKHARITVSDDGAVLEDLGSSNGTVVNGARANPGERLKLANGGEIRFGAFAMTFKIGESEGAAGESARTENQGLASAEETRSAAIRGPLLALPDGSEYALPEGVYKIGRRAGNDLVLSDSYASGAHAQILREGVSVCVIDQGSTNGTYLNDSRLNPGDRAPLKSEDRVRFGNTETIYRWAEESRAEIPLDRFGEDRAEDGDGDPPMTAPTS